MGVRLTHWFYILKDLGETHFELLDMFEGFTVGIMEGEKIIYGEITSDSNTDQY